jgi:hypothetical protein
MTTPTEHAPEHAAADRFPFAMHIRFTETILRPSSPPQRRTVEERAKWVRSEGARRMYEVVRDDGSKRVSFAGDGVGTIAAVDSTTGDLASYDPPQIVLPTSPAVGARWSSRHMLGTRVASTLRECELLAGERCAQGLTSHCTSHLADGNVIEMRVHFCDGTGYVGENDVVRSSEGAVLLELGIDDVEKLE